MRKISYILGFALLSVAFMACDKEPLDEEVINDEYKPGEQILRFELNGVTRIAKGSEIQASRAMDGSLVIQVNIKDELNDFQDISFTIASSDAVPGTYNTALINGFIPEDYGYSEASLNYAGDEWNWSYSTQYNEQDLSEIPDYLELNRGSFTITNINENTHQIEGNFEFELIPPYGLELEQGVPYPTAQLVTNGYFKYITIE